MTARLALAAALVLLSSACDDVTPLPLEVDPMGSWQLESGTVDGARLRPVDDSLITLEMEPDGPGTATYFGSSGCNSYGGSLEIAGDTIRIGEDMSMTLVGCGPALETVETTYLGALSRADAMERTGDLLTVTGPDIELRFTVLPPVDPTAFTGTRWRLDLLVEPEVESEVFGDPATLLFTDDSRIEGSTGCRAFAGSYVNRGSTVIITGLVYDGECPAELANQDAHIAAVLGDFTATLDRHGLTVMAPSGLGLRYTRDG